MIENLHMIAELNRTLGRIEGKLDEVQGEQKRAAKLSEGIAMRVALLEQRNTEEDTTRARRMGYMAGAGAVGGAVLGAIQFLLRYFAT